MIHGNPPLDEIVLDADTTLNEPMDFEGLAELTTDTGEQQLLRVLDADDLVDTGG